MFGKLQSPIGQGVGAGFQLNAHAVALRRNLDIIAEPIDDLIDDAVVRQQFDLFGRIGKHVRQCRRKIFIVDAVFKSVHSAQRGERVVGNLHLRDLIQTVIAHVFPLFVESHQIIMLIVQYHLIGACKVRGGFVQFFVRSEFIVRKGDLLSRFDRLVHEFDVQKQVIVLRLVPIVHRINIFDVAAEIGVGERRKFFDELLGMVRRYVFGTQHAVDEKFEFRILKFPLFEVTAVSGGDDVEVRLFQKR